MVRAQGRTGPPLYRLSNTLRTAGRHIDPRASRLYRLGHVGNFVETEVLAGMHKGLTGPASLNNVERLKGADGGPFAVDAEHGTFTGHGPGADAQIEPTVTDNVEQGRILSNGERILKRQRNEVVRNANPFCLPSDRGQKGNGGRVVRVFGVLEFGQPYTVEAEVIGHYKLVDKVAVAIGQCAAPISIGLDGSYNGDAHPSSQLCVLVQGRIRKAGGRADRL